MNLNLNQLIESINNLFENKENKLIIIELCDKNDLRFSIGDVSYFSNFKKIFEILAINNVDLKKPENIYEILSMHIVNQLSASLGEKIYPEILSLESDPV